VEEGIFKNALYDLYYAKKFKKNPTGSSQRSIKAPPKTGTSNFYMQAGPQTESALLDGIDRGILLTELMGLHTANPVTGDFSLGASGLLIERGKCTQPLRGFAVAGNIFELFRNITDVANDLKFFGSVGAPSVRVSEISVSGA
jgi:PmbA protein